MNNGKNNHVYLCPFSPIAQKRPFLEMSIFQAIFPTILWFERIARSHRIHGIFWDISNHSGFVEKQSKLTQYAIKHPPNITVTVTNTHIHIEKHTYTTIAQRNAWNSLLLLQCKRTKIVPLFYCFVFAARKFTLYSSRSWITFLSFKYTVYEIFVWNTQPP